jgi:hypothetical protein
MMGQGLTPPLAGFDPNAPVMEINSEIVELSAEPIDDTAFQVPNGYQSAPVEDLIKSVIAPPTLAPPSAPPPAPAASGQAPMPIRGGANIQAANLIHKVEPLYPPLSQCTGLIVTFAGLSAEPVAAAHSTMTIRVLDQAHLPASKINKVERYVQNTLASIDVDVKWIDCAANLDACKSPRGPNEFWLRILGQMLLNTNAGTDLLGFTQHGEPRGHGIQCVNIFYPMVEQLFASVHVDSHHILGAAVAHEIGHLYLGTNGQAHSRSGIMCGVWSDREMELVSIGALTFNREQGGRIRDAMRAAAGLSYSLV